MIQKLMRYHKRMQEYFDENSFDCGLDKLFKIRSRLIDGVVEFFNDYQRDDFDMVIWEGWHNHCFTTLAYSIWYLSYVEDLLANSVIREDHPIIAEEDYFQRICVNYDFMNAERSQKEFIRKSEQMNIDALLEYFKKVTGKTNSMLRDLSDEDIDTRISSDRVEITKSLAAHCADDLFDSWKNKSVCDILSSEFSYNWLQHMVAFEDAISSLYSFHRLFERLE